MTRRNVALLVTAISLALAAQASAAPPQLSAATTVRCSPFGRFTSVTVKRTTCATAKRIVRRAYAGKVDRWAGNVALIDGWRCRTATGTTACWRGLARISARYIT